LFTNIERQHSKATILLSFLLLLFLPKPTFAQTITAADYWQQIDDVADLVAELENEPVETQQARLAEAAQQLELLTAVTLPDDQTIPLNHAFLLSQLRQQPPDLERLSNLLTTLQTAANEWPPAQFDQLDSDSLNAILSQPEFQYKTAEPNPFQKWLDDLQLRFWQWVARVFPDIGGNAGLLINRILTTIGILILIILVFYALRDLFGDFTSESILTADAHLGDENLTADMALQRAQQFSGDGDYRTAVRYLYLSSLLLLEERGLLRYNRSLTNREYLRSIAHQPEVAVILRDVISVFDRVWYGFQPLEQTEYEQYAQQVEILKKQRSRAEGGQR
jgi:hypothetical protein